jgi:hypothetical protein
VADDGEGRLPDFFIAGHERCGTTALYKILRQHPRIFLPELKESRYFVTERDESAGREYTPDGRPLTLAAYKRLFAPAADGQLAGDASPQYLRSEDSARLIAAAQPAARIIVSLREPISFLRAFHLNNVLSRLEDERDFVRALELEPERRLGRRIPRGSPGPGRVLYSEYVRYVDQLRRFEGVLPREQIKVIIFDDFRADNAAVAGDVLGFLGLGGAFDFEPVGDGRERKAIRTRRGHRLALALQRARRRPDRAGRGWRAVNALTPALRSKWVEDVARRLVFARPPAISEAQLDELRRRYKPEVVALSEHLGRDLVREWGYDRID